MRTFTLFYCGNKFWGAYLVQDHGYSLYNNANVQQH